MGNLDSFWQLGALSDAAVVSGLGVLVGSGRRLTAQLVAHLGEVEERRLHLDLGHGSMFAYCVSRLGLSEDEACRRIEVARLARRFPCLFPLLASGALTLSVAALLKGALAEGNAEVLLASVTGKSVQQAREVLAAWSPRPDVASTIRKLPVRATAAVVPSSAEAAAEAEAGVVGASVAVAREVVAPEGSVAIVEQDLISPSWQVAAAPPSPVAALTLLPPRAPRAIEPLSAARFKVQFTADAELKHKLELARDLMRHSLPGGDYAAIVSRALDLLVAELMKSHFGAAKRPRRARATVAAATSDVVSAATPAVTTMALAARDTDSISRPTRRAVATRDGLACSWLGPGGQRCGTRAWLEHDHIHPRGQGGASSTDNIRLLCRAHNRRAAELVYGRATVERAVARKSGCRGVTPIAPVPPPTAPSRERPQESPPRHHPWQIELTIGPP